MKTYLISYDLITPGQSYRSLFAAISLIDALAWHGLGSVWIVKSALSAIQIRDFLLGYIDLNDRLLVTELNAGWAGFQLPAPTLLAFETNTTLVAV